MYMNNALSDRNLPAIPADRQEILRVLSREIYGVLPPPVPAAAEIDSENSGAYAGKATERRIRVSFSAPQGTFSFPATVLIPNAVHRPRLFIHIAFRPAVPDRYVPAEEIIDSGCAVAVFCYTDVASDDGDFSNGLAASYPQTSAESSGKISLWAYAAQRLADALAAWNCFDMDRLAVIGHSRLGKTALWCAATDERFALAVSNNAGCSGDALTRGKQGERVEDITRNFPFWFCQNYRRYAGAEERMPFDQHWLLAAIAPRLVFVNAAEQDLWADPESEFLCCAAAGQFYERMKLDGFAADDRPPVPGDFFGAGRIGFAMRSGSHFLSRADWNAAIRFWKAKG